MRGSKNISASLNLFGLSSLCSLSAIPASSIHHLAGSSVFLLGISCTVAAAIMFTKHEDVQKSLSPSTQFKSAAASTAMGTVGLAGSSFLAIRDIVLETSVGFTSMGTGFAMATGVISLYGGLKSMEDSQRRTKLARQGMLSEPS